MVSTLASLDSREQAAVASDWAAGMSSPKHTHAVAGRKRSDGWTTAQSSLPAAFRLARMA